MCILGSNHNPVWTRSKVSLLSSSKGSSVLNVLSLKVMIFSFLPHQRPSPGLSFRYSSRSSFNIKNGFQYFLFPSLYRCHTMCKNVLDHNAPGGSHINCFARSQHLLKYWPRAYNICCSPSHCYDKGRKLGNTFSWSHINIHNSSALSTFSVCGTNIVDWNYTKKLCPVHWSALVGALSSRTDSQPRQKMHCVRK